MVSNSLHQLLPNLHGESLRRKKLDKLVQNNEWNIFSQVSLFFWLYSDLGFSIFFFEAILLKVKTNGTECIKKLECCLIVVSPMVLGSGHDFVGRHHVRGPSCDLTYRSIHSSGRKPMRLCGKKHHFWMPIRMFY